MKALRIANAVLVTGCMLSLLSCGGAGTPAPVAEKEKPAHSWEWTPDDPVLVQGKEVYMAECSLCHNEGEEGAPQIGSAAKWESRIATGEAKLVERAIAGFLGDDGEMPARGGSDYLTDEQMTAAVKFMIAAPKK